MKYYINYHTGAGNQTIEGSIDDAMRIADEGAAYTQERITIEDEKEREVAIRPWWGVAYDPDETEDSEDEVIQFGNYGYYGAWIIV